MFCTECGGSLPAEAKFCCFCGKPVSVPLKCISSTVTTSACGTIDQQHSPVQECATLSPGTYAKQSLEILKKKYETTKLNLHVHPTKRKLHSNTSDSSEIPKGKQGTKGQKQIEEENKSTLNFYLYIISGVNAGYFILQYFLFWDSYTAGIICLSLLAVAVNFGGYQFMSHMAGSQIDLNMNEGMSEHAKDIILYTSIVQGLTVISNYFWLLWLVIPGRAFYLLWVNILGPWFFAPAPEQDEKKAKKMERKMRRH